MITLSPKSAFICHRPSETPKLAVATAHALRGHQYDVLLYPQADALAFAHIRARAFFLLLVNHETFAPYQPADDPIRQQVEAALGANRIIVPIVCQRFDFFARENKQLRGRLAELRRYNARFFKPLYFEEEMNNLAQRFLACPSDWTGDLLPLTNDQYARGQQAMKQLPPMPRLADLELEDRLTRSG